MQILQTKISKISATLTARFSSVITQFIMSLQTLFLFCSAAVTITVTMQCGKPLNMNNPMGRIVGGYDVGFYKYPWMATLLKDGMVYCGGSLIGPRTVITAAHCYKEFLNLAKHGDVRLEDIYTVKLGVYNVCTVEQTQKEFKVQKVLVHELYEKEDPYYDVCLLTLSGDTGNFIPVCLPKSVYDSNSRPKEATILGFGSLKYLGDSTCSLHEARILIYSDTVCKRMLDSLGNGGKYFKHAFCAGYLTGGIDACQGDSGGPLQISSSNSDYTLLGLTSFGYQCAAPGLLGIYTDVSHFLDWIEEHTGLDATIVQQIHANTTVKPITVSTTKRSTNNSFPDKPPATVVVILARKAKRQLKTKGKKKGVH